MKEFKKVYKQVLITNDYKYTEDMERFLKEVNRNGYKIEYVIPHRAYHTSILYSILEEVKK